MYRAVSIVMVFICAATSFSNFSVRILVVSGNFLSFAAIFLPTASYSSSRTLNESEFSWLFKVSSKSSAASVSARRLRLEDVDG